MWKLALLLLFLQAAPAQREVAGPYTFREDQGQTTKVVLRNGLTVIVREELAIPLVSVTTHIKAGYFDEDDRVSGISRVIECLLSGRMVRLDGGVPRSYTEHERTVYSTVAPAANVLPTLDVQANALLHASFDADGLSGAIETVLQESGSQRDNPAAFSSAKLREIAFSAHRIRRWKTGTEQNLRALTLDDLNAFYLKYYRPSNVILTIVGAVDRERVLERVVKSFGDVGDAVLEREAAPGEPVQAGLRYAWARGPVQQAYISMGFHVPGASPDESNALHVLAEILGNGRSSRFFQVLRDQKGLIASGSAEVYGFRDLAYLELDLETSSPLEAASAALAEIENVKRFGVSGEEVARAKLVLAERYFERLQTVDEVGHSLAYDEARGDWQRSSSYLSDIQRVTPQRVIDVARKYLAFPNLSVFEYLPESVERYLSTSEYRAAVLDKVDAMVARRSEEEMPVTAQVPQRGSGLVADMVGTIQRRSILRGPDVYVLEDHRLPLVSLGVFFPGGRLLETERNAGITELMLQTALRGTRSYDAGAISRKLENAGVRIEVVNEPDFFGYTLNGLPGRMDQALQVLVEILQDPLFEELQVESERAIQLARIRNLKDDTVAYPVSLFLQSAFGDHPYARPAAGTEAGVGKLTGIQVRDWFSRNERKIVPTIVIVGDTRGTALVAPIADALTNEDLEPRDILTLPLAQPPKEAVEKAETIQHQQTALVMGFPGVNRSAGDRVALDILASIVADNFVRDTAAGKPVGMYPFQTANTANARGGTVFTYAAFSPDDELAVRTMLNTEYVRLRADGVTSGQLRKAIEDTTDRFHASLQTRKSQVLEYARAIYSGAGAQSIGRYDAAVRAVTAEQMKSVIQRYMDPGMVRVGIVPGKRQ